MPVENLVASIVATLFQEVYMVLVYLLLMPCLRYVLLFLFSNSSINLFCLSKKFEMPGIKKLIQLLMLSLYFRTSWHIFWSIIYLDDNERYHHIHICFLVCYQCFLKILFAWCLTSQSLEVTVWRDGLEYTQKYSRGKPVTILKYLTLPVEKKDHQGTQIRFWPDKEGSYSYAFLFPTLWFFCNCKF